jgi:hypothetical protein
MSIREASSIRRITLAETESTIAAKRDKSFVQRVIRPERIKTGGRLGADFYCRTNEIFEMKRPVVPSKS